MTHQKTRDAVKQRAERRLAEPVANLLAMAYEPRVDTEQSTKNFNEALKQIRLDLSESLTSLTSQHGGQVESVAKEAANRLIEKADKDELNQIAAQLRGAIYACESQELRQEEPLTLTRIEIERVLGKSGRPIGLWR